MKIAIIGAGLSGLGCAYFLINQGYDVTIFDEKIAGGASGIAAGLLHPFTGKGAKLHPFGLEGMQESLQIVTKVEEYAQQSFYKKMGVVRFIEDNSNFERGDTEATGYFQYFDEKICQEKYGLSKPAIFIKNAGCLDTRQYLQALFEMLNEKGLVWKKMKVQKLADLEHYDKVIIAAGAWSAKIEGVSLDLRLVKGQLIETEERILDENTAARVDGVYALNHGNRGIFGATYEHEFVHESIDEEPVVFLLKKADRLGISLPKKYQIKASLRAYSDDHLPIAKKMDDHTYALTGLGSRGMLLHALFAKALCQSLTNQVVKV